MLYPFLFHPIFKERIWGGRNIERLYQKALPPNLPIGESWEISDRPGDESIIANGPLAGKSIRWLMENHRAELLGSAKPAGSNRFPLLIKILDAQEKLSLQVHPPANKATELGGEPKTEMWYIADTAPGADLFVGLKHGVTRADFERQILDGTVAECFHRIEVKKGDTMFLPSGRVHAIGAGNVIFEIQQNSDTTYRVFDWNRVDASGQPRELHVEKSLASIDFNDFEPELVSSQPTENGEISQRSLVRDPLFNADLCKISSGQNFPIPGATMQIVGIVEGDFSIHHNGIKTALKAGQFCLIPAALENVTLQAISPGNFLKDQFGKLMAKVRLSLQNRYSMLPAKMKSFLQRWLINTLAVLVAASVVPGIDYGKPLDLFIAALVLGILNALLRPLLMILSLPLLIFTLGLFTLVINALLLLLASRLVGESHFQVAGFGSAFFGALIISIVSIVLNTLTGTGKSRISVERKKSPPPPDDGNGPVIDV